jgi:hypothetical protein
MAIRLHIPLPGPFSISAPLTKRSKPQPTPWPLFGIMAWFIAVVYASPYWALPLCLGLFLVTLRLRELFAAHPEATPRQKFVEIMESLDAFFTVSVFVLAGIFIFYIAIH